MLVISDIVVFVVRADSRTRGRSRRIADLPRFDALQTRGTVAQCLGGESWCEPYRLVGHAPAWESFPTHLGEIARRDRLLGSGIRSATTRPRSPANPGGRR